MENIKIRIVEWNEKFYLQQEVETGMWWWKKKEWVYIDKNGNTQDDTVPPLSLTTLELAKAKKTVLEKGFIVHHT